MELVWMGVLLVSWLYWIWRRTPVYKLASSLPGQRWAAPLLGHTYAFFGVSQEDIFSHLQTFLRRELWELPYAKFWLGPQLVVVVTDAACVERVIYNPQLLHKGHLLHAADKIIGNGLLLGSGPDVRRRKREILPCFSQRVLEHYLEVFHRHSIALQKVLEENVVEGEDFYLEKYVHCCSFDTVNETSIECRTNCLSGQNRQLLQSFIDLYGLVYEETLKPWLYLGRNAARALGYRFRLDRISSLMDAHIYKALNRKRADIENENSKLLSNGKAARENGGRSATCQNDAGLSKQDGGDATEGLSKQDGGDATERCDTGIMSTLERILRSELDISDEDLVMEIKNIFLASSDTVAQICSFLFKMFAIHPEYQEQAFREAVEVLGRGSRAPGASDVARLQYLERCLKETLRLFPVAPLVPRLTERPLRLDDRTTLPANTTVLVGAYWTHRSPAHWTHPHRFHPAHFTPEAQAARHRGAYLPFSGGPHACIGQQYAMQLMKILAATVLLRFRVTPAETDYAACPTHKQDGRFQNGRPTAKHTTIRSHYDANKNVCQRKHCDGRYIPDDYVAKMDLSSDITVRLKGGISVKMYKRQF